MLIPIKLENYHHRLPTIQRSRNKRLAIQVPDRHSLNSQQFQFPFFGLPMSHFQCHTFNVTLPISHFQYHTFNITLPKLSKLSLTGGLTYGRRCLRCLRNAHLKMAPTCKNRKCKRLGGGDLLRQHVDMQDGHHTYKYDHVWWSPYHTIQYFHIVGDLQCRNVWQILHLPLICIK